jgi:hypothetical protein
VEIRPSLRLAAGSALLCTLAYNLTFFIQELFLVLPKALTPGLRPTLYHNNHSWQGDHPLASLFQGTGALAILISCFACLLLLRGNRIHSPTLRLLLIWMAYSGYFQALFQICVGAFVPGNDVGMAMEYLGLSQSERVIVALVALAAVYPLARYLARLLLGFAHDAREIASAGQRSKLIFAIATVPAFVAVPLIVAFRVPREIVEVVLLPLITAILGIVPIHAAAWRIDSSTVKRHGQSMSIAIPLAAVVGLLLVFQLVLRRGIAFY